MLRPGPLHQAVLTTSPHGDSGAVTQAEGGMRGPEAQVLPTAQRRPLSRIGKGAWFPRHRQRKGQSMQQLQQPGPGSLPALCTCHPHDPDTGLRCVSQRPRSQTAWVHTASLSLQSALGLAPCLSLPTSEEGWLLIQEHLSIA
ncbi:hypothetical protein MDA_GLEAN10007322 [Myotis davidii]|uniref:Uncharacterized protein n=1 Tax=Myotis davidii TaxID=225400 RepID=L5MCE5_MYODS|nr:hypothetical protein MDA_GLEAN10007322 [Myotis davidii]